MTFHAEPNIYVSQIELKVQDLQRSLDFYQNIIGFKILNQTEQKAVLTADGNTPLVTIEQLENIIPKQPRTTGLYHYALLLPSRADLARIIQHFIKTQFPLQGASDHLVSEALYLADPDGNGIEIYSDRPASQWEWKSGEVAMDTRPLDIEGILADGDEKPWTGLPSGTIMGHIHLHVSELKKTEEFYCNGLQFDVVTRYGGQALFISTGKYHHHIGLNTWAGIGAPAPAENSVGMSAFTIVFPSETVRDEAIGRLRQMGVTISEDKNVFIAYDPSGNRMKLTV
ncbi:VOC family protein [Bacillus sp. B15-48]|uniref:VOC family protein n=1 Tax=Bacillus sp. B15-48 TaxID=1548601 RepID=UPI0019401D1A|nr:VOC family protein [Bacillus sp. B15-48]MBM4760943.1 glyoxalase [Bacillus sp. B15-48]